MGVEIERKYLVDLTKWDLLEKPDGSFYRQGYMHKQPGKTIRVRVTNQGSFLTIKGKSLGASRPEYEYAIPTADAEELLRDFCDEIITKMRYRIAHAGKIWEVDVFSGDNEGLVTAEIELTSETETFEIPDWIGKDVTDDKRYFNSNLSVHPYTKW
ncbi:CYTH domain-containing protein [Mucilaginibacter sp. AW1-3]